MCKQNIFDPVMKIPSLWTDYFFKKTQNNFQGLRILLAVLNKVQSEQKCNHPSLLNSGAAVLTKSAFKICS